MAKWLSEKGREVKGKGEKERYTHLNAEFQRIARREKKAFLSDQCKQIEENNRMIVINGMSLALVHKSKFPKSSLSAYMNILHSLFFSFLLLSPTL